MEKLTTRAPDFRNLAAVLEKKAPSRATLFEFYLNNRLYSRLTGQPFNGHFLASPEVTVPANIAAGYDYVMLLGSLFNFPDGQHTSLQSRSLNDGSVITDRASFDAYEWPDPLDFDYGLLDTAAALMPKGMSAIVCGPGGVLENVIRLVGYENLCFMLADDEPLAADIFEAVGSRMLQYYKRCLNHPCIAAVMSNDDWGFAGGTMLTPDQLRRHVFPWHKQIVALAHASGRYAMLHSCGNYSAIIADIIDDMKFDARHSYEDNTIPVERAYEALQGRIAVLGGLDVDFLVRSSEDDIRHRAQAMLSKAAAGGYALGSGNSIPEYIPDAHYFAMIKAGLDA